MKTKLLIVFCGLLLNSTILFSQSGVYYTLYASDVNDFIEVSPGELWVAADSSVRHYTNNGKQQTTYSLSTISGNGGSAHVIRVYNNDIYVALDNGVYKYDGNNWVVLGISNSLSGVSDMEFTNDGTLWCIAGTNVYRYSNGGNFTSESEVGYDLVTYQNTVFLAGNDSKWRTSASANWTDLPYNTFGAIYNRFRKFDVDKTGRLWGANQKGVAYLENQSWINVLDNIGLREELAAGDSSAYLNFSTSIYGDGHLYHVSTGGGLDTILYPTLHEEDPNKIIKYGMNGNIWLLKNNAIFSFFPDLISNHAYKELTINKLKGGVSPAGDMFSNFDHILRYQTLRADGKTSIFAGNLWIGAQGAGGLNYVTAGTYKSDFSSGPNSQEYDHNYIKKYNRVWKVTRAEVNAHRTQWLNPSYIAPKDIETWPGNGDITKGETQYLAPFIDHNSNGIYEPEKGEYPDIRGDEALYYIFNDIRGPKSQSHTESMGLEIHAMMYSFDSVSAPELHNSIFFSYKLHNKSNRDYSSLRLGFWLDVDLGNAMDDLMGCDSMNKVFYAYNANANDAGPQGYGLNPPAIGGVFLSDSLASVINYNNSNGNPIVFTTEPIIRQDYLNYLNSTWKNGQPLRLETPSGLFSASNGDGYEPSGSSPLTNFMFNDAANWYAPLNNFDKRLLATVDIGDLATGENRCVDLAIIYARDSIAGATPYSPVSRLKTYAGKLKQFYADADFECLSESIGVEEEIVETQADFYPNPVQSGELLNVLYGKEVSEIKLIDSQGRVLMNKNINGEKKFRFQIPYGIANGLYFVYIQEVGSKSSTLKISVR